MPVGIYNMSLDSNKLALGVTLTLGLVVVLTFMFMHPEDKKFSPGEIIATTSGKVQGIQEGGVSVFKGIPYAAPPVGELRWRPPQPFKPGDDVLKASRFGPACFQPDAPVRSGKFIGSEDCLYLNVWSPHPSPAVSLPVLFYIHGGAYFVGAASDHFKDSAGNELESYGGDVLAREFNVVVVTINYRLGTLGFLGHPALSAETSYKGSGNYGFTDQIQALKWVQKNIQSFGGNPERMMIFGTSAGASSVTVLLASPEAKGLFSSAIIQSADDYTTTLAEAEAKGITLAQALHCDQTADTARCLRSHSAKEIYEAIPLTMESGRAFPYAPNIDNYILPEPRLALIEKGKYNRVPVIVLSTAEEYNSVIQTVYPEPITTEEEYQKAVREYWTFVPGGPEPIVRQYPSAEYASPYQALIAIFSDYSYTAPARRYARALASHQNDRVWKTVFAHTFRNGPWKYYGPAHGMQEAFIFQKFLTPPDPDELAFAKAVGRHWTTFAATGNPNSGIDPQWETYDRHKDNYVSLEIPITVKSGFRPRQCDFWDSIQNQHYPPAARRARTDGGDARRQDPP